MSLAAKQLGRNIFSRFAARGAEGTCGLFDRIVPEGRPALRAGTCLALADAAVFSPPCGGLKTTTEGYG